MVPSRVVLKFYLRSTFLFRGTGRGFGKAPLQKHKRYGAFYSDKDDKQIKDEMD
jgi:hypothetical protein